MEESTLSLPRKVEVTISPLAYCLYARKSTESDERQALSIDSQINEMKGLAKINNLEIVDVYEESHSAKASGCRPVYNKLLMDIHGGKFNGVLTWAPDRLSRNAGDLGILVDLMDQGKLLEVRTFSQTFANNPNEKFLLMILCSQAKLENDNRGINVKRGIRAKCEMGWRPGMPPLGYYNRAFNGLKDIMVDEKRARIIKEMFLRVAKHGHSGRTLKTWLEASNFTARTGKNLSLSRIYNILKNPFYYGQFEYPTGAGKWYKGSHEPLITKEVFDKVQKQLFIPRRSKWGSKSFIFKGLMNCASCGASVVGEEKYRKLKNNGIKKHIYYHCSRSKDHMCKERYISEEDLIKELVIFINNLNLKHFKITEKLEGYINEYQRVTKVVLRQQGILSEQTINLKDFAKYVLEDGSNKEKRELLTNLKVKLYLKDKNIIIKTSK
jgi:DNA invertase Pin-like site-specific DNA recombinase